MLLDFQTRDMRAICLPLLEGTPIVEFEHEHFSYAGSYHALGTASTPEDYFTRHLYPTLSEFMTHGADDAIFIPKMVFSLMMMVRKTSSFV